MKLDIMGIKELLLLGLISNLIIAVCSEANAADLEQPPNVLIIYADDLGYGELSAYGAERVATPNCDRIADEGVRFTQAYTAASVCTPARYSLLTGRYPWRTWKKSSVVGNTPSMFGWDDYTLPKLFKSAGYTTAAIGKWHIGFGERDAKDLDWNEPLPKGPIDCVGFDYFFGNSVSHFYPPYVYIENRRVANLDPTDPLSLEWPKVGMPKQVGGVAATYEQEDAGPEFARRVNQYIRRNQDRPFFLVYNAIEPHTPFTPHSDFQGKTENGVYGDFILQFDYGVGSILDTLDELGLTENTIVILTSDNGGISAKNGHLVKAMKAAELPDYYPNAPLRGDKGDFLEGGLRIPFIIRWPGMAEAGIVSDQVICQTDLLASFAELLAVTLPVDAGEDSRNVLAALKGGAAPDSPIVLQSRAGHLALRQDDWIYLDGGDTGDYGALSGEDVLPAQLYNLREDLHQDENLYHQYPERAATMKLELEEIRERVRPSQLGDGRDVHQSDALMTRTHLGWNDAIWGDGKEAPKTNNHYVISSLSVETWIHGLGNYGDFAGKSLTLREGGTLFLSGEGELNLILDQGQLQGRGGKDAIVRGSIEIRSQGHLLTVHGNLDVQAALFGSGNFLLSAAKAKAAESRVIFNGDGANYRGSFQILENSPEAAGFSVVFEQDYPHAALDVEWTSVPVFQLKGHRTFRSVRMGQVILQPGTYTAEQLLAEGVTPTCFKDLGGSLTVR